MYSRLQKQKGYTFFEKKNSFTPTLLYIKRRPYVFFLQASFIYLTSNDLKFKFLLL